jgi:2-amino-4-hydroxy-6-hydroxymethyldihydropteridine diphosphokinase
MNTVYLLLGGNQGDKEHILQQALVLIEEQVGEIVQQSAIYITAAWGNEDQPRFYNQAIELKTNLSATAVLKNVLKIEETLGRKRNGDKWQQRTMDIDLLFYNDEIINLPHLKIPHPYIQDRRFVLIPLCQLAKERVHPILKKTMKALLLECKDPLEVKRKL